MAVHRGRMGGRFGWLVIEPISKQSWKVSYLHYFPLSLMLPLCYCYCFYLYYIIINIVVVLWAYAIISGHSFVVCLVTTLLPGWQTENGNKFPISSGWQHQMFIPAFTLTWLCGGFRLFAGFFLWRWWWRWRWRCDGRTLYESSAVIVPNTATHELSSICGLCDGDGDCDHNMISLL